MSGTTISISLGIVEGPTYIESEFALFCEDAALLSLVGFVSLFGDGASNAGGTRGGGAPRASSLRASLLSSHDGDRQAESQYEKEKIP